MADRDYDWISRRAYSIWEEEGRPQGRDSSHWQAAVAEWDSIQAAGRQTAAKSGQRIAAARAVNHKQATTATERAVAGKLGNGSQKRQRAAAKGSVIGVTAMPPSDSAETGNKQE